MTITPILWYRPLKNGTQQIKIRIYNQKVVRFEDLGIAVEKKFWDDSRKRIRRNHPNHTEYNLHISQRIMDLENPDNAKVEKPIESIEEKTIGNIISLMISELESEGRIGLSKKYKVVLGHLKQSSLSRRPINDFNEYDRITFNRHLTNVARVSRNTLAGYNKNLRRFINFAIEKGYRTNPSPFKGEKIREQASKPKHSLNLKQVNDLKELIISHRHKTSRTTLALASFIFSIHSYGMRFGDVVTLKWKDFRPGMFQYIMLKMNINNVTVNLLDEHYEILRILLPPQFNCSLFKDGVFVGIPQKEQLTPLQHELLQCELSYYQVRADVYSRIEQVAPGCSDRDKIKSLKILSDTELDNWNKIIAQRAQLIRDLVEKYIAEEAPYNSDYVFPLLQNTRMTPEELHGQISSKNAIVNKSLKQIAKQLKLPHISFHSARHTFAVNQYLATKDVYAINRALKHKSLDVTIRYLQSLNIDVAAKANKDLANLSRDQYAF